MCFTDALHFWHPFCYLLLKVHISTVFHLTGQSLRTVFLCYSSIFLQVERINDEGVKLKILQTSLTLMQLPELVQNEVGVLFSSLHPMEHSIKVALDKIFLVQPFVATNI